METHRCKFITVATNFKFSANHRNTWLYVLATSDFGFCIGVSLTGLDRTGRIAWQVLLPQCLGLWCMTAHDPGQGSRKHTAQIWFYHYLSSRRRISGVSQRCVSILWRAMKQVFPYTESSITHPWWTGAVQRCKINEGWKQGVSLTVSWSCCCSKNAENSNIQSLELATLRPCQAGADGEGERPVGDSNPKHTGFI